MRDVRNRAGSGLIEYLLVVRSAGMRDLPGINGSWMEERHDVYECCAFADWRRDTGTDTVRLHSHEIVASATAQAGGALGRRLASVAPT